MLLILCVASTGPALGNVRQSRLGQTGNMNARNSPPPTSAAARNGISESATHCPTRFVTAVVPDGQGGVWVSGEDFGIYHGVADRSVRPDAIGAKAAAAAAALAKHPQTLPRFHWQHFDVANSRSLASNFITALCVDDQGRLWAGTNRHGVCVFNGKKWKHYNIVTGPLGSHVYALAYNAIASQVWIATENGISIYQCGRTAGINPAARRWTARGRKTPRVLHYAPHTWHYITAMNGLPPNPDCMAFDGHGNAFVGTRCNGLAIGTPAMALSISSLPGQPFAQRKLTWHWRVITGPQHISQLRTAYGYGLPGNLINCVLVAANNHIYVGTDWGLAYSTNDGQSFRYERGQDYAAKIMGLWHPPRGYRPPAARFLSKLLPGDHITCLAQDADGNIWIGTWRNGYEVLNPQTGKEFKSEDSPALAKADGYISQLSAVTAMSARKRNPKQFGSQSTNRLSGGEITVQLNQTMLIGRYGFGVHAFGKIIRKAAAISRVAWRSLHRRPSVFNLPRKATPPTEQQLLSLNAKLALGTKQASEIRYQFAAYLGADWVTQGDWVGGYGRQCAVLCAAGSPADVLVYWGNYYGIRRSLGPEARPGDSMRAWITWKRTDNPNSLWDPAVGARRQAEHDDHGEAYKPAVEGPGLWYSLRLPAGEQRLSLYFFNKDGHVGANRDRDYTIRIYPWMANFAKIFAVRPLACARVEHFWGGVYQQFKLAGPGKYILVVGRNNSFNTILSGIFVDRIAGPPLPTDRIPPPWMGNVKYGGRGLRPREKRYPARGSVWAIARRLIRGGKDWCGPRGWHREGLLAFRYLFDSNVPSRRLVLLRQSVGLWSARDRAAFHAAVMRAWDSRQRHRTGAFILTVK